MNMDKKYILLLLLALVTSTGGMAQQFRLNRQKFCIEGREFVQNYPISDQTFMKIPDFTIGRGESADVTVSLHSVLPIWMLQLYIQLPEGLSVTSVNYSDVLDYWTAEGSVNPNSLTWGMVDSELRIISMNNSRQLPIPASPEGQSILTLHFEASADMVLGDCTITTNNFKFVAATSQLGEGYIGSNTSCTASIIAYVTSIALNKSNTILYKNEQEQLEVSFTPSDATETEIVWNSSDETIATVDANGMVTAHAVGTASITATSYGTETGEPISVICVVEVRSYVESINIDVNPHELTMDREDWMTLTATVLPENAYNKEFSWTSLDPSVATVDEEGHLRAVSQGRTSIIATAVDGSGVSDTLVVIVKHFTHAVSINPKLSVLYLNETRMLTAAVDPADATDPSIEWLSVNPEIATVDANGIVTGHSVGLTGIIAVNYGGRGGNAVLDTATVDVRAYVESVTLNKESTELYVDDTEFLTATVLPANAFNKSITWTTSDASVATVNEYGMVTAIGRGTATITATTTDGTNLSASCQVNVLPPYALEIEPLSHLRGAPAETVEVAIRMINKELISDLQFDITLPEGVEFAELYGEPDIWLSEERRARNHQLSVSLLGNGDYRVLVSSPTSRTFKDHDGTVIFMNVILPQYHDAGDFYITFSGIKLAEADETAHTLVDYNQTVHYSYVLGDADADTLVDVGDYTATALTILEQPTIRFYEDAANVNDVDEIIDVYDLRGIVNIILGLRDPEIRPAPAYVASEADEHHNDMALSAEFSILNNQFSINLENSRGVAAMQMDVTLPAGVTVSDAVLTERAHKHQLSYATLANGQTRLLISACSDAAIKAGDGAVVNLTLEGMTDGTITVDNILAVEPNLVGHRMQPLCMTVSHTGVNQLLDGEGTNIRIENGSLVIDSERNGMAQLVMLNGIVMPLQVKPGRNSYQLSSGYYILRLENNYVKVRIP